MSVEPQFLIQPMPSEWIGGWKPLFAGFAGMAIGWNAANIAASLFLKPMQADFGWTRTELSFGPLASLIVAFLLPFSGQLIDRVGVRRVAIAGVISLSSAWMALSLIPARHDVFWAAVIWLGIAGAISNSIVFARGVAPWFSRNLGLAIGLMMTGASVGSAIGLPLLSAVIADGGWRAGFRALALATLAIGLPLILLWFRGPSLIQLPLQHDVGSRSKLLEIASSAEFWKLTAACAVAAIPIGGFIGHLVPLLTDAGLAGPVAAGVASFFAIAVGIGRVFNGFMLDRLHPPLVVFCTLTLAAIGVSLVLLLGVGKIPLVAALALIGMIALAQGAEGDYIKFFSIRLFGLPNFARVVALMAMTISLGMAFGGLLFAWIFDRFGSYTPALFISVLLYLLGGLVFYSIRMNTAFVAGAVR